MLNSIQVKSKIHCVFLVNCQNLTEDPRNRFFLTIVPTVYATFNCRLIGIFLVGTQVYQTARSGDGGRWTDNSVTDKASYGEC